ncbi:MAG: hypothetical protein K8R23_04145 [Chthoniobacter sp.]|nr:hypothetical protein [Chthoniobacter sp.]
MKPGILVGTHYHAGDEAALCRQSDAHLSICKLHNVQRVNLQFASGPVIENEGFTTVARLRKDSSKVSGLKGPRKPVLNEICSLLAEIAVSQKLPYFMLVNSDEMIMPPLVELVLSQGLDAYIFSRMDFNRETGEDMGMLVGGQGCWVMHTEWWHRHGWRIRPYIMGEAYIDTILTTKLLCHGRTRLFNRGGEFVRHEAHPRRWPDSPFLNYTRYLASLDSLYLSIWHEYIDCLEKLRHVRAPEAEEIALQDKVFKYQPSLFARFFQIGRASKAYIRFRMQTIRNKPARVEKYSNGQSPQGRSTSSFPN